MDRYYDLLSWIEHYERARAGREPRESVQLGLSWRNSLALLRGV
jgi:hypothetical protein